MLRFVWGEEMERTNRQVVSAYVIVLVCFAGCNGLTTIPPTVDGGTAVLVARVNATNVTVFCRVTDEQGGPLLTTWILTSGGTTTYINTNTPGFVLSGSTIENLTISSYGPDRNGSILECTNNILPRQSAFFSLRIFESPVLSRLSTPLIAVEGKPFSYTDILQTPGFPPVPSYKWFHNGEAINTTTSTNPNVSVYPLIVFSSVLRTQSGNYTMTASSEGGVSTGYFILDVLAPPDGIRGPSEVFGVTGMDMSTITAFTNVTGNPTPNSTWTRDSIRLTSGRIYNTDSTGILVISNVMLSDTGNYTNTLHNMFNNESFTNSFTISLQVLSPPGSPQSVSVISVTSSSVVLRWLNPLSVGQPAFVRFSIELATISKVILMSANAVNNTDSSFINTLTMTGLDPNTNYTLCIRTVSTHPAVGELVSDSIMQAITTNASVPQFEHNSLYNIDGMLKLEWTLRQTGGIPIQSISVTCSGGNSTTLSNRSVCTPDMCGARHGSTRLGPVMAGNRYTCSVTASNAVGNSKFHTNTVLTITGIPSIPIVSVSVDGQVRLQITTAYAGVVAGDNSLHFNVSVYNITSSGPNFQHWITLYSLEQNFVGLSVLLSHDLLSLQPGSYLFSATAGNTYGSSPESELTAAMTIVRSSAESPVAVIVVASVISVVIVVIAVSMLITVLIYMRKRTHSDTVMKNTAKSTTSPTIQQTHPVALQHVQTVENVSYGVLGGGVPQSIELKENASYSTVKPLPAPSQSIAVNSNVAYGVTSATTDP